MPPRSQTPPTLDREPFEGNGTPGSRVTRFGTVVGGGVLAALVASIPAELRIGGGSIATWLALSSVITPIGIGVVFVFRRARVGLRHVTGNSSSLFAFGVLSWAVIELVLLSIFGSLLRAKTHHHGLAGVAFAAFVVVSGLVVALLARRGIERLGRAGPAAQRLALAVSSAAAFVLLVLVALRMVRATGLVTAAALVDVLALLLASTITSSRLLARVRPFAIAGVPLAAGVLLLGLRAEPLIREAIMKHAPLHAWVINTVWH
ncbi:MAG: hypothetical protein FWD73_04135 [Polyangiaceae bacterium]|nr:hypothetical protein [Polyangiaceae bacterium]